MKHAAQEPAQTDGWLAVILNFLIVTYQGIRGNGFQLVLTAATMGVGSLGLALSIFLGQGALQGIWLDVEELMGHWVVAFPDMGDEQQLIKTRPYHWFSEQDYEKVSEGLADAKMVAKAYFSEEPVTYMNNLRRLPLDCLSQPLLNEPLYQPVAGRRISQASVNGEVWECLLTVSAEKAMGLDWREGPSVIIAGYSFKVVGLIRDPPRLAQRFQYRVVVPYIFAKLALLPPGTVGHIVAAWHGPQDMDIVLANFNRVLTQTRGKGSFFLDSTQFALERGKRIINKFMGVGLIQALFCIFIASIGVLNVMLTNVSRRSHEFAIRVAMGATKNEILLAVMMESLLLGLFGAMLGIVAAIALAPHLGSLLSSQIPEVSGLSPVFNLAGVVLPFVICGICSLAAGSIPALRVRRLDILSALRHEG